MRISNQTREIISLAWPAVLSHLTYTVVSMVDMLLVGTISPASVAAVGLGGLILWVAYSIMSSVSVGTTALVARFKGSGDKNDKDRAMAQSIVLAVAFSALITLGAFLYSRNILLLMGVEDDVAAIGSEYINILLIPAAFIFISFVSESGLRAGGDTRTPLRIDIIINGLNIALDYLLIFGHLGFPRLGVRGAAIASAAAFTLGGLLHLVILTRGRHVVRLDTSLLRPDVDMIKRLLTIGVPASMERIIMSASFIAYTAVVAVFGTLPLAATQIGIRIEAFSFMPGIGFSVAAAALVGQNLGAGQKERAYRLGWSTSKLAVLFMLLIGLLMFFLAPVLIGFFTEDSEVLRLGTTYLRIVGLLQPLQAILFVLAGSFDGAGDTRWVLYTTIVGMWIFRLPLAYVTGVSLGFGVIAAWLAMAVDVIIRSIVLIYRYRTRAWMNIKI